MFGCTFKEKLPEIFPGRTEVPKTLVFAKNDLHAEDMRLLPHGNVRAAGRWLRRADRQLRHVRGG